MASHEYLKEVSRLRPRLEENTITAPQNLHLSQFNALSIFIVSYYFNQVCGLIGIVVVETGALISVTRLECTCC